MEKPFRCVYEQKKQSWENSRYGKCSHGHDLSSYRLMKSTFLSLSLSVFLVYPVPELDWKPLLGEMNNLHSMIT